MRSSSHFPEHRLLDLERVVLVGIGLLLFAPAQMIAQDSGQITFSTAQDGAKSLMDAIRADDKTELVVIFGDEGQELISSGDEVADKQDRQRFLKGYETKHRLVASGENTKSLHVGADDWGFPIPLVRNGGKWYFDTAQGKQEILYRRIGRNELGAIDVCQTYVQIQRDYASSGHDGETAGTYAQQIMSNPGKHNGLYWETKDGETQSPAGLLLAQAAGEGYSAAPSDTKRSPYHGYFYRILKAQGNAAPGGARDYVGGGKLASGFALVAFPAEYRSSGVMTFIVNQQAVVYQKDLGENTANIAGQMTEFNPDKTWTHVR
jgi:hypothetical protein